MRYPSMTQNQYMRSKKPQQKYNKYIYRRGLIPFQGMKAYKVKFTASFKINTIVDHKSVNWPIQTSGNKAFFFKNKQSKLLQ